MSATSPSRLLRFAEVKHRTGLSRTSLFRAIRAGHFPAPIALSLGERSRCVAWPESSVDAWIASRIKVATPEPIAPARRSRSGRRKSPTAGET
ncbi:AlpA family phage regulatory protein [Lysobacter sp. MMG2]|uniref:helix-turn-helix transcriptional regulator n=1 Tax=Lysobacter sp. MMG2 TaxID=2801338 RepID=UPI001C24C614|nr:AlpA family phage regulatory protein [Lysobacter sp. MMG2]MBU8974786.1 AlpA family phage regulatory protein [Lysobacter sp. MMG2]